MLLNGYALSMGKNMGMMIVQRDITHNKILSWVDLCFIDSFQIIVQRLKIDGFYFYCTSFRNPKKLSYNSLDHLSMVQSITSLKC